MFDLLKNIYMLGFDTLQEAFYFYAISYLAIKLGAFLYKVFMRKRVIKDD